MAKLFMGKTAVPKVEDPKPLPDANDPAVVRARRRRVAAEVKGTGVQSTILSTGARETLGG